MAFADPQSVTIGTTPGAVSLPRTGSGQDTGAFKSADGLVKFTVASSYGKRTRRTVRLTRDATVTDPLIPAQSVQASMSCYIVVDTPVYGFTVAEQKDLVVALATFLTASSGAKVTQLLGGEN